MNKLSIITLVLASSLLCSCASTKNYFANRGRDAMDIATISGEHGFGAMAQAGPLMSGIGVAGGAAGLRNGYFGICEGGMEMEFIFWGYKSFSPGDCNDHTVERLQNKQYEFGQTALFIVEDTAFAFKSFQIEAALNLGIGLRAGLNFAELIDFLLGWTTVDILNDDVTADNETIEPSV